MGYLRPHSWTHARDPEPALTTDIIKTLKNNNPILIQTHKAQIPLTEIISRAVIRWSADSSLQKSLGP